MIGGENVLAGSAKLMQENGIRFAEIPDPGTKVYVAADGRYIGCILIADELKPDTADALQKLRRAGIGVAVSNGWKEILPCCDDICMSNNDDGPAWWLNEHYLNSEVSP